MAFPTEPVEVITLAEYHERVHLGQTITPGTLLLMPVTALQQSQEPLTEQDQQIINQGCKVLSDWASCTRASQDPETLDWLRARRATRRAERE